MNADIMILLLIRKTPVQSGNIAYEIFRNNDWYLVWKQNRMRMMIQGV